MTPDELQHMSDTVVAFEAWWNSLSPKRKRSFSEIVKLYSTMIGILGVMEVALPGLFGDNKTETKGDQS